MKKHEVRPGDEINKQGNNGHVEREAAMRGDKAFKLRMLRARKNCRETFVVGVDPTPGTEQPLYVPHRALPVIRSQSPAALCAEWAGSVRAVSDSF